MSAARYRHGRPYRLGQYPRSGVQKIPEISDAPRGAGESSREDRDGDLIKTAVFSGFIGCLNRKEFSDRAMRSFFLFI